MYKGLYYIYIVAKNTVGQKKKLIFQMVNHTLFLFFTLYLYKYVYEISPNVSDKLPYTNAVWSMAMYFVVFWLALRDIQKNFRADIRSGNIETYLLRPMNYIWQRVFMQIGQGLIPFLSALVLSVLVSYFIVGLPEIGIPVYAWILGLIVIFLFSQVLMCLIFILCGLSGFWLDDSEPVYFIVSKFMMIFGGAWVPVAFFPKTLQLIAEFSPFGAALGLSYAMYPNFGERFFIIIANVSFWVLVCLFLVHIVSKRAMSKLSVNG